MKSNERALLVACGAAGLIGPVVFATLVIVQEAMQPDYSRIEMPISALSAWPLGWLQNLNFYAFGACLVAYALGLHATLRPTRHGSYGIAILLASGVGVVLAGVFPWIRVNEAPTETPAHVVAAVMTFVGGSVGNIVVSRRMTADPRWRALAAYVLATGIAMLALFVLVGFAMDPDKPFHEHVGLLQRTVLALWFPCIVVLSLRVLRLARRAAAR